LMHYTLGVDERKKHFVTMDFATGKVKCSMILNEHFLIHKKWYYVGIRMTTSGVCKCTGTRTMFTIRQDFEKNGVYTVSSDVRTRSKSQVLAV